MTQPPYMLDLRDLMDAHYGVGAWTLRTGVGTGSDIGPALNDGLTTIRDQFGRGKILIPPGMWLLNTCPNPALLSGNYIEGAGSQASTIVYNSTNGTAFYFNGAGGYTGGGIRGIALMLESGLGNTSAYGIRLQGNAVFQPDQTEFEDIYLTAVGGSSYWWDGFHADGSARSSPQGCRVSKVSNVQVFNCRNVPWYLSNIVQWTFTNVGAYTGTGPYAQTMIITGGSAHVYGMCVNAALNVSSTSDVYINGSRIS